MDSKHYKALVSPDAYGYLDGTPEDELLKDPMLEEQESEGVPYDDYDEYSEEPVEDLDDSDQYLHDSLFDEELLGDIAEEEPKAPKTPVVAAQETENNQTTPEATTIQSEELQAKEDSTLIFQDEENDDIEISPAAFYNDCNDDIHHIISLLPSNDKTAMMLQDMDRAQQNDLADVIKGATRSFRIDGKDKMFIIPHQNVSVAILSKTSDPMKLIQRLENIGAVMVGLSQTSWTALMLYIAGDGTVEDAETKVITRDTFNEWQWKTVVQMGERIRAGQR